MNTCTLLFLSLVLSVATAYESAPSPQRARQLAALSRRRATLVRSLSEHQARMSDAARTRAAYETSVAKFDKLLSATESACRSDHKACVHIDTVRAKLNTLRNKLHGARELEGASAQHHEMLKLQRQLAAVEQRMHAVRTLVVGRPSVAPRPIVTIVDGRPTVSIPRPQIPDIVIPKPQIPRINFGY
eukprot:TRINITY_DN78777_c0_g1_i1.p2 TRINITY_DN78777_c0_g1~~TRINITY_DN78777_c0_g1_i1.p2  ORF type:complete len:187 (+),score=42.98 TRINITY_DN78777_c0_g1_i1:366-926(+)